MGRKESNQTNNECLSVLQILQILHPTEKYYHMHSYHPVCLNVFLSDLSPQEVHEQHIFFFKYNEPLKVCFATNPN